MVGIDIMRGSANLLFIYRNFSPDGSAARPSNIWHHLETSLRKLPSCDLFVDY
ncbi:hypothetical protein M407DRAFT_242959 [Tulasnella calospora MUT 4182]|uniref:Uncharacterized protein n=1 Tax=Tulasnella calospora MUT 4182 TaxID=1051891 RepID=A0A0C3QNA4_9AGAM|nr:hypothetical protein M407DRAFT_242959 [Tulasnella calospora MUT 4182]